MNGPAPLSAVSIFDYYISNTEININFIPIVFKYIKNNNNISKNLLLSDTCINHKKFILPNILSALNILIIGIGLMLFFIDSNFINAKKYKLESTKIFGCEKKNICEDNKYEEITISNDNYSNQLNTSINTISDNKIKLFENTNKNINDNNSRKNIWLQSSQSNKSSSISINYKNINLINNQISKNNNILNNNYSSENNNVLKDLEVDNLKKNNFNELNDSDVSESEILFGYN